MNHKMNNYELGALIISTVVGVGVISIPRRAVEGAGIDGIFSTIISGLIFTITAFLFAKFIMKFQKKNLFDATESLAGKLISKIIAFVFFAHFFMAIAIQVRYIGVSVKQFILFNTPIEVIIFLMLFVVSFSVYYGLTSISKVNSNLIVFTMFIILVVLFLSLRNFDVENFYSIFSNSFIDIIKTSFKLTLDYSGFEILLLAVPLLARTKDLAKVSSVSMLIVTGLYTLTAIITIGTFQTLPTQYIINPTAILSKAVFIEGFAERIDIIFITFWIISAYMSMTGVYFISCYAVSKIFGSKSYKPYIFLFLPLVYILSLMPQNPGMLDRVGSIFIYTEWFGIVLSVFILFIISLFKRGGKKIRETS